MTTATACTDDSAPLNEAWWDELRVKPFVAPDDVPILAPYEKARPGFEALVADALEPGLGYRDVGDGHVELCLWNIFHEGDDDPADADDVKQKINDMQRALDAMSDDDRYVRIQAACLVRCFWTFPQNVDQVIDGIASGEVNLDDQVACEPPWNNSILPTLRSRGDHPNAGTNTTDSRHPLAHAYIDLLTHWLACADIDELRKELPEHAELADTIYRRLGPPDPVKMLQVERLRLGLGMETLNCMARPSVWPMWEAVEQELGGLIRDRLGHDEGPIASWTHYLIDHGLCHHAFFRRVDHLIAAIGKGAPVTLSGAGENGKRVRGTTTNYVHTLGSWLANRTVDETVAIWPNSRDVASRVFARLGPQSPRKRWLVACLWKHLQDSMRRYGHGALTDEPERFAIPAEALTIEG